MCFTLFKGNGLRVAKMKALDLAKYVILISYQTGYPVSNLQLQKILYFANMFYIKKNNKSLIKRIYK